MLTPPPPAAWLAYALTMSINPNNHALDGGPPTSEMEKESVQMLGEMVGYEKPFLGHLTSDRKSTRLNSSHVAISYAVFCLKKKKEYKQISTNRQYADIM